MLWSRSLLIQARGVLKREPLGALRRRRMMRRAHGAQVARICDGDSVTGTVAFFRAPSWRAHAPETFELFQAREEGGERGDCPRFSTRP